MSFGGGFCQVFWSGLPISPVVAEGVEDAAYVPGVFGSDGAYDGGSGGYGAVQGGFWVFDGEDHADGATVEGLGAEVFVIGGFVGYPEAVAVDCEVGDYGSGGVFVAEELFGSEGGFVEVYGFGSVADGEEGGEGGGDHGDSFGQVGVVADWRENGSRVARMPNHTVRLHEWGTRSIGTISCMGHPPYLTLDLDAGRPSDVGRPKNRM
jgi:hypothetical protein